MQRQADALQSHQARLGDHAAEVVSLEEQQRSAIARIRVELERSVAESIESMQAEIEIHASERRRALHEVSERLRTRERSLREQIEREELELRSQLDTVFADVERRQLEQLERSLDRAAVRLVEEAERRFDTQLKESREQTAERLRRELELTWRPSLAPRRRRSPTGSPRRPRHPRVKLQRQIDDVVRAAEVQTAVSNERIQTLSERLEHSLEAAHERLAAFEAHVELELSAKLGEMERTLRAAEQSVERERA